MHPVAHLSRMMSEEEKIRVYFASNSKKGGEKVVGYPFDS